MVPIIGFCGASNSGKTTLVCQVLTEMAARGLRVGAIKHHGHGGPVVEPAALAGKDSARLAQAGALRVGLAHGGGLSLAVEPGEPEMTPQEIASRFMYDLDLVVVEGFKGADIPKIEVVAPDREPILPGGGEIVALARRGGGGSEAGLRVINADDPLQVTDFALANVMTRKQDQDCNVTLLIDGKPLGSNGFVRRILDKTIRGVVDSLKGGGNASRIEVIIGP